MLHSTMNSPSSVEVIPSIPVHALPQPPSFQSLPHSRNRTLPQLTHNKHTSSHFTKTSGYRGSCPKTGKRKLTSRRSAPLQDLSRPANPPKPGSTSLASARGHAHS